VQGDMKHWPFTVVAAEGDKPIIQVQFKGETKQFTPEQISSYVLQKMKDIAEAYIGKPVKSAVVTVPGTHPFLLFNLPSFSLASTC
jgi:L1 cell adhesion molecule like protein